MKLILNDIKDLSLEHINIYKNRIYYEINNIRFNGLFIRINKNMIQKNNKYIIQLDNSIETLNDYSNPIYAHPAFWGNFSIAYRNL